MNLVIGALASVVLVVPMVVSSSAIAQATRTWVSGVGDDANPCSRTAPCKTFAGAISKTATSGEINCLDPGGFGAVTITKSITISCINVEAGVLASGSNAVVVNTPAGSEVHLQGLDFFGVAGALDAVRFVGQGQLHIENSSLQRFSGQGVDFAPIGPSELYIRDTVISEMGLEGVSIKTTGNAGINAVISRSQIVNNRKGVAVDGAGNTLPMNLLIADSVISGNTEEGVIARSVAAASQVRIAIGSSRISANVGIGASANGAAASGSGSASIFLTDSIVFGNAVGVGKSGAGVVQSLKNNSIFGNINDGTPLPAFPGPGGIPLQ